MSLFHCLLVLRIATNPSSTAYTGGNLLGPEGGHRGGRTLMMHFLNYNVFREHCLTRGEKYEENKTVFLKILSLNDVACWYFVR